MRLAFVGKCRCTRYGLVAVNDELEGVCVQLIPIGGQRLLKCVFAGLERCRRHLPVRAGDAFKHEVPTRIVYGYFCAGHGCGGGRIRLGNGYADIPLVKVYFSTVAIAAEAAAIGCVWHL